MGRRPGLNEQVVVEAATQLINQGGLEALSIAVLAEKLKVKPPSLYNHVKGLAGLQKALTLKGGRALTQAMQSAAMGLAGYDALVSVATAYRDFAKQQPGLYSLTQQSSEGGDPELQAVGQDAVAVVLAVLRGYQLEGDEALHATRCLRSALHGFVLLEAEGGFGLALDLDTSFKHMLRTLDDGFSHWEDTNGNAST